MENLYRQTYQQHVCQIISQERDQRLLHTDHEAQQSMVLTSLPCFNYMPMCTASLSRGVRSGSKDVCGSSKKKHRKYYVYKIKNKKFVITGAAEGIGYEMSRAYLKKGAAVVVMLDNQEELGCKTLKKLQKKYGENRVEFMKCDVVNDLEYVYCEILNKHKTVDVLVNNAGILDDHQPRKTIDINITGSVEFGLKFWHHMRKDKGGKGGTIINLSSIYGFRVHPYFPVYQCTKFAIMGFTKTLGHPSNYRKSGVRVVCINPGFTKTKLVADPNAFEYQNEVKGFVSKQDWQPLKALGRCAIEVYERAPTGTAWLTEGDRLISRVF